MPLQTQLDSIAQHNKMIDDLLPGFRQFAQQVDAALDALAGQDVIGREVKYGSMFFNTAPEFQFTLPGTGLYATLPISLYTSGLSPQQVASNLWRALQSQTGLVTEQNATPQPVPFTGENVFPQYVEPLQQPSPNPPPVAEPQQTQRIPRVRTRFGVPDIGSSNFVPQQGQMTGFGGGSGGGGGFVPQVRSSGDFTFDYRRLSIPGSSPSRSLPIFNVPTLTFGGFAPQLPQPLNVGGFSFSFNPFSFRYPMLPNPAYYLPAFQPRMPSLVEAYLLNVLSNALSRSRFFMPRTNFLNRFIIG